MAREEHQDVIGYLRPARVLVVSTIRTQREALTATLASMGADVWAACDGPTAAAVLHQDAYEVAVIGDSGRESIALISQMSREHPSLSCILTSSEPTLELATSVMRAGGVDLIDFSAGPAPLARAIDCARRRSRSIRARELAEERRATKLRRACRQVQASRQQLMDQLGSVCTGVAAGYRDLNEQMKHVAMAAEFNAILRQELELESLLRMTLEYALKKTGPTNAAIFLPSTSGDFTLGAYVNYDCPKECAEMLLDHLADVIAPAFEHREDIAVMKGLSELRSSYDGAAAVGGTEWLEDSAIAAFACRQDGECLGVVVLFRDRRNTFAGPVLQSLKIIRDLFGKQLSRVIKTHHRHQPKHQWGGFASDDDIDLAA